MPFDWGAVAREAWAMARRDAAVLAPLGGLFLALPLLVFALAVPAPPALAFGAADAAAQAATAAWLRAAFPWIMATGGMQLYGAACILIFYLDRRATTLGGAMVRAALGFPRFLLASLLVLVPAMIGAVLVLPGLYVLARAMLLGPVIAAEPDVSVPGAIARALRLSHRRALAFLAMTTTVLIASNILPAPFTAMAQALVDTHAANPVVMVLLLAIAAAIGGAISTGFLLVRVVVYRRLAPAFD